MNVKEYFIYLLIIVGTTYLIRAIPFVAITKKIKNKYVTSFLYYIPYTVLAAMTFPTSLYITGHIISSVCGLVAAILVAIKSKNLTLVATVSCLTVLVIELILMI